MTAPKWGKYVREFSLGRTLSAGALELDDDVLTQRITLAEDAVRKRMVEVRTDGNGGPMPQYEERHRLEDASYSLQCLRRISQGRSR